MTCDTILRRCSHNYSIKFYQPCDDSIFGGMLQKTFAISFPITQRHPSQYQKLTLNHETSNYEYEVCTKNRRMRFVAFFCSMYWVMNVLVALATMLLYVDIGYVFMTRILAEQEMLTLLEELISS